MVRDNVLLAARLVGFVASVTEKETLLVPRVVGVPVIAPVAWLMLNPFGSPEAVQTRGLLPPVADNTAL